MARQKQNKRAPIAIVDQNFLARSGKIHWFPEMDYNKATEKTKQNTVEILFEMSAQSGPLIVNVGINA